MNLKSKYIIEGIVVIFVMMILLYISMPLFIKGQKAARIKTCQDLLITLRDMCVDDPKFLHDLKSKSKGFSPLLQGPINRSNGDVINHFVQYNVIELDMDKLRSDYDEVQCSDEILEEYKFYGVMAYQRSDSTPQPLGVGFSNTPFYFSFTATNDLSSDMEDAKPFVIDVNDDLTLAIHSNRINPYNATNGIHSIGGFTYDSIDVLPLPTAVIIQPDNNTN